MMNYEEIKAMTGVLANNDDAFTDYKENSIFVTLNDCDENWEECDYNNEEAVDAFIEALEDNCIKAKSGWGWVDYTFDNFIVNIRYVSSEA